MKSSYLPVGPEVVSDCDCDPVAPVGEDGRSYYVVSKQPLDIALSDSYLEICLC